MMNLIRQGIDLTESLAVLPLRATRQLLGPKNPTFGKLTRLTEGLVTIPFRMARETVDFVDEAISGESGGGRQAQTGPGFKNLFVNPEVTVVSDSPPTSGSQDRRAVLRVTGLLCHT